MPTMWAGGDFHERQAPPLRQVVRKLREADRLLAERADVPAVCRHLDGAVCPSAIGRKAPARVPASRVVG